MLFKLVILFDFFLFFFNVFILFLGMSLLIIVVVFILLRKSLIDLIIGVDDVLRGKLFNKIKKKFINKKNVKKCFSFIFVYSGFWKLILFGGLVLLILIVIMFGLVNYKIFNNIINDIYKNRDYRFKIDLELFIIEGKYYLLYNLSELKDLIYIFIGLLNEGNREIVDYFKLGKFSIINLDNKVNGNFGEFVLYLFL